MDKQREEMNLEKIRTRLAHEKSFLGKVVGGVITESGDGFEELFEKDLKRLKVGPHEQVIAEMNNGDEYFVMLSWDVLITDYINNKVM
ncbi:hypothetical protein [Paenibacillus medicaginis]|uniref:Uncharacterized protein n=1 Tax=Paenibacillus medicaginis TaxID=1470560 RepID=A0ABV5C0S2_9BACL